MSATVNVNGRVFDQQHAVISVFDHGFLYGEGVYETLRTFGGRPFLFDRHMQRLRNSSGMLRLSVPLSDEDLKQRCRETMDAASLGHGPSNEAYIRILLTRGVGELTYDLKNGRLHSAKLTIERELKNHQGENSVCRFSSTQTVTYVEK